MLFRHARERCLIPHAFQTDINVANDLFWVSTALLYLAGIFARLSAAFLGLLSPSFLNQPNDQALKHRRRGPLQNPDEGVHDDKWPGCMVSGHINVNRVPGNFHVEAASKSISFHGVSSRGLVMVVIVAVSPLSMLLLWLSILIDAVFKIHRPTALMSCALSIRMFPVKRLSSTKYMRA